MNLKKLAYWECERTQIQNSAQEKAKIAFIQQKVDERR